MTTKTLLSCLLAGALLGLVPASRAQENESPAEQVNKADAYYHFALGHLYSELAGAYGNKSSFVDKAIDNYRLAMEADPGAGFLSEELSDLYIQAGRLREAVLDAEAALREDPNDLSARRILARIYTRLIGDSRQNRINEEMVQKAIEQYEKIAEIESDDPNVWRMLGGLYKLDHDSVKAEAALKKALAIDETNEEALVELATVYADLGDLPRAAETLRQLTGSNPTPRTLAFLAGLYEKTSEYSLAAETYRQAVSLSPRNMDLKRRYAQSLLTADQADDALKVFEELAAEEPDDYESNLRRSQIYRDRGELEKAREAMDAARETQPDNLEVQYNNVNLLEAEGKQSEALAALQEILESTTRETYSSGEIANRTIFLERLGLMYRSLNQFDEAVGVFREVEGLDPGKGDRASAQVADTYRQAKDYEQAYREIERAYEKFPESSLVGIIRATILADSGRRDEANRAVEELTEGAEDRESCLTRAQIYEKTRSFDLMAAALDRAWELSKTGAEKSTVLFMQGAMYERMKEYDKAEESFREVLKLSPDNASAMNYMGYMFADRNVKLDEALELIQKALEYEPNNGAYLDSLGWAYYRLDRLEEAEKALQQAAQTVATDPVVHDHLGDVYARTGRLKEAINHWKISLKEWKSSPSGEKDPAQIAQIEKKLEGAEVQLAKESSTERTNRP